MSIEENNENTENAGEEVVLDTTERVEDPEETERSNSRYNLRPEVKVPDRYQDSIKSLRRREAMSLFKQIKKLVLKRRWLVAMSAGKKGFRSYKKALLEDPTWEEPYTKELRKLETRGGLKVIRRQPDMDCLPFVEVISEKTDNITGERKRNVRLAIRGDLEKNKPENTFSPTIDQVCTRVCLTGFHCKQVHKRQGDCPGAYLNGRLDKPIYLFLPEGHEKKTENNTWVYECPASVYGLVISGKIWHEKFRRDVKAHGLEPCKRNPCMFIKNTGESILWLILYVDDFLFGSESLKMVQECEKFMQETFEVKSTKDITKFVGAEIEESKGSMFIHQDTMINKLSLAYEVEPKWETPMLENLRWKEDSVTLSVFKGYKKYLGNSTI